jgi:hypothetical protein
MTISQQKARRSEGLAPSGLCTAVRTSQARQNTGHNFTDAFKSIYAAIHRLQVVNAVPWRGPSPVVPALFSFAAKINHSHFIASLVRFVAGTKPRSFEFACLKNSFATVQK